MQSLLLLVAPALLAASIYMELGRIVIMVKGEDRLFIRRTWLTKIFVTGDVISFMVQASGAGLLSSGDYDMVNTGKYIVMGGLLIQVLFFGMFVIAAAIFHFRMHKAPTALSFERPWTKHMMSLYIVSVLIFVRCIIRVVEYTQGYDGYLMTHEVYLYVFDATLMLLAVAAMNWIHPGEVARYVRQLRQDEKGAKQDSTQLTQMNV